MESLCMLSCRFPSISKAASTSEFRCPQKYITPFKFLAQKFSIRGNNRGLFYATPIIKRDYVKMTVAATSSAANKGGMGEEKGKETQISLMLVKDDRNASSLGQKLKVVQNLVAENIDNDKCLEALTYSAIYLKWINTRQIPWSEDVGDAQPNKYAEILRQILCHLERICSKKDISVKEILVIRNIHRCLSSFKEFTTSVPITRFEDVAHRELESFFNAGSLEQQLGSIRDSLDQSSAAIPQFSESKQQLDNVEDNLDIAKDELMKRLMNVLHVLDYLRQEIEHQNDSPGAAATVMRQKWRLCEIGLEDYSSVLLSRFLDSLEAAGGANWLAKNAEQKNVSSWSKPLGALVISIHQLGLSGWKPEECRAIGNELIAWQETSLLETEDGTRIWGLRLKATLDRAERLIEEYSKALLEIFPEKVKTLGEAFDILENSSNTYVEAEIRASVIFHISNLCCLLLKAVRKVVKARDWDILVRGSGTALGKIIQVENFASIPSSETEDLIVVVNRAVGNEEVKAGGAKIEGVILLQRLPRLCHLVFGAQDADIVVVTCEDDEEVSKIQNLTGEVSLVALPDDGVSLNPNSFDALPGNQVESKPPVYPTATYKGLANIKGAMRIKDAEKLAKSVGVGAKNICGAKAAACSLLASLAAESNQVKNDYGVSASFKVPKGAAIPFGSIQRALDEGDEGKKSRYESLIKAEHANELHDLVSTLIPSEEVIEALSEIFDIDDALALRRSASVEDLRGVEVAGKDKTILNASLSNPEHLKRAISRVWASLYTPGVLRSLRDANVALKDADIAVLVQEMLSPDLSFVLHIVSPMEEVVMEGEMDDDIYIRDLKMVVEAEEEEVEIEESTDENGGPIEVEISPGLGEVLDVDTRASPWRLSYDQSNGTVETLAFANLSHELVVGSGQVVKVTVDYSKQPLSTDHVFLQQLGRRLGAVGRFLGKRFRGRHDAIGCVVGEDIYIELMRPHPRPY